MGHSTKNDGNKYLEEAQNLSKHLGDSFIETVTQKLQQIEQECILVKKTKRK